MRPMRFLLNVYLPEHYKSRTGTTRKVRGKNLGLAARNFVSLAKTQKNRGLTSLSRLNICVRKFC